MMKSRALVLLLSGALVGLTACGAAEPPPSESPSPSPGTAGSVETRGRPLTEREGKGLVSLARYTLKEVLAGKKAPVVRVKRARLNEAGSGAFVTLTTAKGDLRGCIGRFESNQPLYVTVQAMAIAAALRDRRFKPVTADELPSLSLKISVLSPLRRVKDPAREVKIGEHGIYVIRGSRRGCFLPEVAAKIGAETAEKFLSVCAAHKAGLAPDAWKAPDAEVYVFTTQGFGEGK